MNILRNKATDRNANIFSNFTGIIKIQIQKMEVLNLIINIIVLVIGVIFLGLIILGVYNVVVRKRRYDNMYKRFDDTFRGTKRESDD